MKRMKLIAATLVGGRVPSLHTTIPFRRLSLCAAGEHQASIAREATAI